jgi:glutathione S-transferase
VYARKRERACAARDGRIRSGAAPETRSDGRKGGIDLAHALAMRFVEIEEARAARGLRIVIAGGVPSPWSQAAMGLFDMKGLDYLAVRLRPVADQVRAWTGSHNAPVVVLDDEPPRTGWADIVELAERLGESPSLVPYDPERRVRMFGLAHELLGPTGVAASVRLLLIHASFMTDGREGWPIGVAKYLAPKYGYAPDRVDAAKTKILWGMASFDRELETSHANGSHYVLGAEPCALDVHLALVTGVIEPLPHDACPMLAPVRHAFETLDADIRSALPASLRAHRERMYARHLPLPMRL